MEGNGLLGVLADGQVKRSGAVVIYRIHIDHAGGRTGWRAGSSKSQDTLHDVGMVIVGGDLKAGSSV